MSVHVIYYKDGAKMLRPVLSRGEYLALRGTEKQKAILRKAYKNKKFLPLDLCPKKTRSIRRKLTKHQQSLKTEREKKREMYSNFVMFFFVKTQNLLCLIKKSQKLLCFL